MTYPAFIFTLVMLLLGATILGILLSQMLASVAFLGVFMLLWSLLIVKMRERKKRDKI